MMDYIFTTKRKEIKGRIDDTWFIYFFGDIHRDTRSCDVDRWKWFIDNAKKSPVHHTYFFGMGDYCDFMAISERRSLERGKVHDDSKNILDELAERNNRMVAEETSFMRGRILGLLDGNHNWLFQNGKTGTEDLAERLDTEPLGWLCHYTLNFTLGYNVSRKNSIDVHFVLCHGKAGGKTAGITINQVDDLRRVFPVADVYCMGHDHERGAWPKSVIIPTHGGGGHRLKQKRQFLCRSGSFKKGYEDGVPGYEVGRLLKPSDIGALKLRISFHRDRKHKDDRVITDITAEI